MFAETIGWKVRDSMTALAEGPGGIMVIQSGIFVRRFGAYGLLGFGAGYATLREVGPILIGLMFALTIPCLMLMKRRAGGGDAAAAH